MFRRVVAMFLKGYVRRGTVTGACFGWLTAGFGHAMEISD